ncbi:Histone-lysine N-methyltransferase ASHH1 [Vitis vinifera]|uniref:Histone-lysine N-methyltransferase ASHH1 n=1 Tax=Vitis vinifera TaxID=29760 RepID=A0A438EMG0_VITVI|nr:Histone-lysine N-methyltransferase ASHH1 [Vitis vinifera]
MSMVFFELSYQAGMDSLGIGWLWCGFICLSVDWLAKKKRKEALSHLASVYREIEPAIEDHDMYGPANVLTDVAEQWIGASCRKLKAEFNLHSSIIRNLICPPQRAPEDAKPSAGDPDHEIK